MRSGNDTGSGSYENGTKTGKGRHGKCADLFSDTNPWKTLAIRPFSDILNYINALLN